MGHQLINKNGAKSSKQFAANDSIHHGKMVNNKTKYNHMSHWIEEEMQEVTIFKKKKKVKS